MTPFHKKNAKGKRKRSSAGTWYCCYQGKRTYLIAGPDTKEGRERAIAVMKRKCPPVADWRVGDCNTVAHLAERYLELVELKGNGFATVRNVVKKFVGQWGKTKVRDLLPIHLTEFLKKQKTWNQNSKANATGYLQAVFNWAVAQKLIFQNPFAGVRCGERTGRGPEYVITNAEHEQLYARAGATSKMILAFLHDTGCRPSECMLADRDHYDSKLRAFVYRNEAKTKNRVVRLSGRLVPWVEARLERREILFVNPRTKQRFDRSQFSRWFRALKKRAGITRKEVIPYSYRHKFITDAIVSGLPTLTVAQLVGHTTTMQIEKYYAHLLHSDLDAALEKFR